MKEYQRKQLLERIEREGATVGNSIPETISLDGEPFNLHSFIFDIRSMDTIPSEERERIDRIKKLLRRERLQRKQQLANRSMTYTEGEELAQSIIGIDRALTVLENLQSTDIEAEIDAQEKADAKRWFNFLRKALGTDSEHTGIQR
ncbi:MAG: DUF5788 family protein [Halobacteriaceae archaeon]